MKKILLLISLVFISYLSSYSQGTCAGAAPFCTASGTTFPASTGTTAPVGPNYGCLGSEPNPAWYYLQISAAGNININLSNSAGVDIDFCSWGPFATQSAMCPGTSGSPFDCSYSTAATEQVNIVGAVVGQWYMVLITNYANVPTNISATTTGGTTGATNCAILCNMTGLTAIPGACNPGTNLYTLSGTITTTTPPGTGTLTITNSCGGSQVLSPPFATSIAYSFPGMTSNGAGCSITATYSADPTCSLTTGYTAPASCTGCVTTAGPAQTVCASAVINLTTTNAGAGYTYSWTGPAFASGVQNPGGVVVPAAAGTYTYSVTATNGGTNCTSFTTVTVKPTPVVNAEPNLTFCAGAAVPANTFASTPAGATFTWTNSNAAIGLATSGITSTPAFTATNGGGAPITSTITITPTLTGCPGPSITYTITVNPLPVTTVNSSTICPGGTATLTAAGATTYLWNTGSTANPLSVSPASTTSYTVTGTTGGCTSSAVATVTIGASISPTVNSPTICAGAIATLTATGGTTYLWNTGSAANPLNVTPVTTTSYTVTATTGGCTGTVVATVTVNPLPITTVNSPAICAGATATLTAGGAASYLWNTGSAANPLSVSPAATTSYTVTGTSLGCTSSAVGTVTVNPIPVTTVNSPTICPGGTATLTAGGATTYLWNTGSAANPLSVSPASTTSYTVTGTSLGCTSSAISIVTVAAALGVTVNSPTICNGAVATLTAGGATTYLWNTGSAINPLNVTPATTTSYTVTGTTAGCTGTAVATVTVNPLPVTTASSSTICDGATTTLTAGGATTYLWNTGSAANPLSVTPSTTTSYTVTGTSLGCTSTAVGTVTVNPIPVTTVNSPSICPASTATLTAGGATTYLWSTGSIANPLSVTPAATTSYTVTGTSLGCSSTAVSIVTVTPGLTPNAGLDDTVCFGGSIVLNVTPNGAGYSYAWTPAATLVGAGTFNPTASPVATTNYSVTVTDPSGCTGTDNVTIYADPQITMAIAAINVTCNGACNGQTIVIPAGGTPVYTYSWNGGCNSAACNSLCPGTYTVTITDSWGCTGTANTTVTEPTLLTASNTGPAQTSCNGVCDATVTAAGAGGTIGYNYSWNTVPVQNTATASGLCAGSYTCTVTDANSCTATTVATITEPTIVVIAPIANVTICSAGTINIVASASGGNGGLYAYVWSPAAGLDFTTISNPNASPVATTIYTVNANDNNGCPAAPVNVTVTVNPALAVVAAGTASVCPGASAVITALASLGNGGPYTYSWSPAAGLSNPLIANPTATPAATTTYTVTANDGCSPSVTATVTVTVLPLPVVAFAANNVSGCSPLCVIFTDNTTVAGSTAATWDWNFGDGGPDSTSQNPSHCFYTSGSYNITLTVTSTLGGCTSSASYNNYITVFPDPVANFTAPLSTSIVNPVIPFTDNSTGASTWYWNFGDTFDLTVDSTSNLQNPIHTYSEAGNFCALLTVQSINGCISTYPLCVVIDPEFTFFIPNAFSPNGDGINDEFIGKGDFINAFEMFIYDRWGNLIFYSDDIHKGWDGKANHGGEMAQQDVYVYSVKIKDNKEKKHKYIGTVTIVK